MGNIADRLDKTREVAASTPASQLKNALERFKPQLSRSLPAHMNVDRFLSVVNGAVGKNPAIADCDPHSILQAVGQAARMGLEIDVSGHGYLVPYDDHRNKKKICQFIPGWQGIVDLINRSGRGVIRTGAVFDGDFFEYDLGLDPFLRHRNEGIEVAEKLLKTYAIGTIRGEGGWTPPPIIEVWSNEKIRHHLDTYNKVGEKHYALKNSNNWIMYARKIPLLQVAKYMPKSAEISAAIAAANRAETGEPMTLEGDFVLTPDGGGDDTPTVTYAELAEKIKAAKNRDGVDLVLDMARALPPDQQKDLAAMADQKFPRA